jgi:hypothetical protein
MCVLTIFARRTVQGHDIKVSDQVLNALSARLDHDERSHLFSLAAVQDPTRSAQVALSARESPL